MKPHICFVSLNAYPLLSNDRSIPVVGGAELQQVIVARLLHGKGFKVSFICLDHGQPDKVEFDGIVIHSAYHLNAGVPGLRFFFPRLFSIWRALANANADIYYHRTAGMLTGVVAAFCKRHEKKSIFAAAGDPDLERRTPRIRFARDRKIFEYGVRNVDQIVVQNEKQRALCKLNYGRRAILIPNSLPKPNIVKQNPGHYVLWVSTIRSLKRPQLMINIAKSLHRHKFIMIGGRDQFERLLYENIKDYASHVGNLDFLGYVPFDDIDKYFDDAALVVNTSESEGFPNTFLQAWSRSIPTVSFIDCGARLHRRPVGIRTESTREMAHIVDALMNDIDLRFRHGRYCYEYYLANNTPDIVVAKYEKLLTDISTTIG